jgi:two-component system sensor histidine kinase CreC
VRVVLDCDPALQIEGDRFLLQRAVANLLQNAVDFSEPGGEVTIGAAVQASECHIAVRDCGAGVPPYALERVFEKFYSLRRPDSGRKGTGLGLSFVKEIAALHRGRTQLRNHPDGGAEAVLVVPLRVYAG